ncbi:MAG: transposase [Syntrophotalea acetylenica]|nr:transposase [Syntrophotalea acetylenica]
MTYCPDKHHRRSIRLSGYDYSQYGAYFVTVCTRNKECLFGEIENGVMKLNDAGKITCQCWQDIPMHFPHVATDRFEIMPNHIHGILFINNARVGAKNWQIAGAENTNVGTKNKNVGAKNFSPLQGQRPCGTSRTIGSIIRGFKIGVTKWIRENTSIQNVWQRNYYEHVIRTESEWNRIRQYIADNPARWDMDRENPNAGNATMSSDW